MIKSLKKQGIQEMFLNILTAIYDKPVANAVLNGEKTEPISSKETKVPSLPTLIQYSSGIPRQRNRTREKK
jgi:hypothetical protein